MARRAGRRRPCAAAIAASGSAMPWIASGSRSARSTVWRGMQRAVGVLEHHLQRAGAAPSTARRPTCSPVDADAPARRRRPGRRCARSTVDLPEPDSPTMPKVSPGATAKRHVAHRRDRAARRRRTRPSGRRPRSCGRALMRARPGRAATALSVARGCVEVGRRGEQRAGIGMAGLRRGRARRIPRPPARRTSPARGRRSSRRR